MHPATARLNGSFGDCKFAGGFLGELITVVSAVALLKSYPKVTDGRGHAQLMTTFIALSGSSLPKQR